MHQIKPYDSYHFGSLSEIGDHQLKQLIRCFSLPKKSVHSALGGRTSITVTRIQDIGSVVIKHYRRGGAIRYLIKKRYLKCGKTRCQIEYELLQKVRSLGINAPDPVAFAYVFCNIQMLGILSKKVCFRGGEGIASFQTLAKVFKVNVF